MQATALLSVQDGLELGAGLPFAEIIAELRKSDDCNPAPEPYLRMAAHVERVAGRLRSYTLKTLGQKCSHHVTHESY